MSNHELYNYCFTKCKKTDPNEFWNLIKALIVKIQKLVK